MILSGNFLLTLPGLPGQRVIFHGAWNWTTTSKSAGVDLSLSLHEPKQSTPGVTLAPRRAVRRKISGTIEVAQGTQTLREGNGTPEEILDKLDLRAYGIDARSFSHLGPLASATTLTAHRGVLHVNDEDIESFVVTIHQGEGMDTAVHVNQLGQILAVKTFLGYDLYDETLAP